MAIGSLTLLKKFQARLLILANIRDKQEKLFFDGHIINRDLEEIYAITFLNSLVSLEALIEELFFGLLVGAIKSRYLGVKAKIKVRNYKIAYAVVHQKKSYIDWLPYERTMELTEFFFENSKPFSNLNAQDILILKQCATIRNVIVHQSNHAKAQFQKHILSTTSLNPRDKKPKRFLRVEFSLSPKMTYHQHYLSELVRIAQKVC